MEDQTPPAMITLPVFMLPFSVMTPLTAPPWRSIPRTAQDCSNVAPFTRAARAMAGAARQGSMAAPLTWCRALCHPLPRAGSRAPICLSVNMRASTPGWPCMSFSHAAVNSAGSSSL